MPEASSLDLHPDALPDPWDPAGHIPLRGWLERQQFPPLLTAILGLILALILFQAVVTPIVLVALLLAQGVSPGELLGALDMERLLTEHFQAVLLTNTAGQVLGLALPALLLTRLHTARPAAFLRMRKPDAGIVALAVLGLLALTPAVQWLASVNELLPLPDWEWLRQLDASRLAFIEQALRGDHGWLSILFALAVIPAICEELLFRGYVQRQAERSLGVVWGIVFSGVVFGLYHLSPTQALPLSVLGVYLAFLAWRTGNLWVPVAAHFTNNAMAVALGAYAAAEPDVDLGDVETMRIPWYIVMLGLALFALVVAALQRVARHRLVEQAGAR